MSQSEPYIVKKIPAADTLSVRQQVLRPNLVTDQCHFEGDQGEATFHMGAILDDSVIGIATMMIDHTPELAEIADLHYRLRGMAVLPEYRNQGLGGAILEGCLLEVKERGCKLCWCNARVTAARFYTAAGFSKTSENSFEIADVGPHFLMYKQL